MFSGIGCLLAPDHTVTPVNRDMVLVAEEGNGNINGVAGAVHLGLGFREFHGLPCVSVFLGGLGGITPPDLVGLTCPP